jgi:hypothetical protein
MAMSMEVVEFVPGAATEPPRAQNGDRISTAPPVRGRELLCLAAIVALADVAIYRGEGFAGYSLLFGLTPLLLYFGVARRTANPSLRIVIPLLVLLALRLLWCGNWLAVSLGFGLLACAAMGLSGLRPYVFETVVFVSQAIPAGLAALFRYAESCTRWRGAEKRRNWLAIIIPAAALLIFSTIFILANPDLLTRVSEGLRQAAETLRQWLADFAPGPLEVCFWIAVAWIASGLLRPLITAALGDERVTGEPAGEAQRLAPAPLYEVFRNTLAAVVVLFAAYLAFEFATMWTREFPPGALSGYCHQGAAWLTVALALATMILSVVFQGQTLRDPRLAVLRRWGAVWSIENFVLAFAVVHRMSIYADFNGMTRMRTVGLLGITAVVAGFVLVLVKISRSHSFLWLVRRQLWALAFCVYLYAVLPVDTLVMSYNVRRIMAGDPAPSVQISVHPISDEGLLVLKPLLQSDDAIIREGVRAMLAERLVEFDAGTAPTQRAGWSAYQLADELLHGQLHDARSEFASLSNPNQRRAAREAFDAYAYQWY